MMVIYHGTIRKNSLNKIQVVGGFELPIWKVLCKSKWSFISPQSLGQTFEENQFDVSLPS